MTLNNPTGDKKVIVWFRKDLRLLDNPSIFEATSNGYSIIPIFIWGSDSNQKWAPGEASKWWLHNALASLASDIAKLGGNLSFYHGDPSSILPKLVRESSADGVYFGRAFDPYGMEVEASVINSLRSNNIHQKSFNNTLLVEPWEVQNKTGKPFQVFTPFWRHTRKYIFQDPLTYHLDNISFSDFPSVGIALDDLGLLPRLDWHQKLHQYWEVSEDAAHKRLAYSLSSVVDSYSHRRNIPGIDGTSRLSPYLAWGLLSPRQICHAVLENEPEGSNRGQNKFLTEVGWREFSYHLLYHYPTITDQPLRPKYQSFPWLNDPETLDKWKFGNTGYPMVDAGMRQLYETGWMHNRVRMVVASFLVKHLLISWNEGAKWFWDTLVDADLASNTQGWQWAAGCGADAAPYFRIFNPILQGEKFDAKGNYVRKWIPPLDDVPKKWLFSPWDAPKTTLEGTNLSLGENYPEPCVEHKFARARALEALSTI